MRDRRVHYVGLLLVAVSSFVIYNWLCAYVILAQRELTVCFFMFDGEFLQGFLDHPGGLLHYAGRFLGQFYHYTWLGALVLAVCITGFGVVFHLVLTKLKQGGHIVHTFLPCILLLVLHTSPSRPIEYTVGLIATCSAFLGYAALRRRASRHIYALLVTPALYVVVGGHVWLFAVWVATLEWLDSPLRSNVAFKLLYPALVVCMPLVAYRWLFPISFRSALMSRELLSVSRSPLGLVLSGYLLLMPFWRKVSWGEVLEAFWRSKRGRGVQVAFLLVLAASLVWAFYDPRPYELLEYRELYKRRDWDAILERARRNPTRALMVQFFTNYALFKKGKLLEEMFHYPQVWGPRGLVLNFSGRRAGSVAEDDTVRAMYSSDLFFEMGHVNAAFRQAYNHMAILGRTYENIKRIAECNMVNGNYEIADKYLTILERTLFHRKFARYYKGIIADSRAADRCFGELRARLPTVRLPIGAEAQSDILRALVESNPHNRMAFDYLTAWYLLEKTSMPLVAGRAPHLTEVGYTSIPTHLQEALILLEEWRREPVAAGALRCDTRTASRVRAFLQELRLYGARGSARRGIGAAFGDTYLYYWFFVATPGQRRPGMPQRGRPGGSLPQHQ